MLPPLATEADATAFGLTVTDAALRRASVRVRAYVGQQITYGTSTITGEGPTFRLPERPVVSVDTVEDSDGTELTEGTQWVLAPGGTLVTNMVDTLTVTYTHGMAQPPDALIELVCTIAARLDSTDDSVAAGVQQESSGSVSQTFGWDAWKGIAELTAGEKAALDRLYPKLPNVHVQRPAALSVASYWNLS